MTGLELVEACQAALKTGVDFPTIWNEILKASPLVIGPPVQTVRDGRALLEIRLLSGGTLVFDSATNKIAAQ